MNSDFTMMFPLNPKGVFKAPFSELKAELVLFLLKIERVI